MSSAAEGRMADALAMADRPPTAIMVGLFLAAYLSWRPSIDIMFTVSDLCLLIGGAQLLVRRHIPLEPFGLLSPLWFAAFALMMGGLLVSSLFCHDPTRWIIVALQYSVAWAVLPFLLMGHGAANTNRLACALLFGVFLMELVGILVYFTYSGSFEEARATLGLDFLSGSGRLGAFATDANWNGATISMALPFAFYLRARRVISLWQMLVIAGVLLYALLLSASATAFGSMVVAILFFVLFGDRPIRAYVLGGLVGIVALGIVLNSVNVTLPAVFQKRVANALETGDIAEAGTFEDRLGLAKDAWQRVGDHMFVGVGVDQDRVISPAGAPVHNMYLLLWVEGGFLALVGWIAMIGVGGVIGFTALKRDRLAGALALSVLATFLLFSAASPHMYARLWAVPVLLALAIALHGGEADLRRRTGRALSSRRMRALRHARG
jgi:O-antigen ligase